MVRDGFKAYTDISARVHFRIQFSWPDLCEQSWVGLTQGVSDASQCDIFERLDFIYVGLFGCAPEPQPVGPCGFKGSFINEEFGFEASVLFIADYNGIIPCKPFVWDKSQVPADCITSMNRYVSVCPDLFLLAI